MGRAHSLTSRSLLAVWFAASTAVLTFGCNGGGRTAKDAGPDAGVDTGASPSDTGGGAESGGTEGGADDGAGAAAFALLVTESPPGPTNGNPASWGGVLQYTVAGNGAALTAVTGIPMSALADPVSLTWRAASSEVFVGNRHGNNSADGTAGSIARFLYNRTARSFTANGTITGNGLSGVHGIRFNPATGELFAANFVGGVSRFTFDTAGAAVPNGTIGDGTCRGVAFSADGRRLFVTTAAAIVRQFELPAGTELAALTVPGSPSLHEIERRGPELYIGGLNDNSVHRLTLDASNALTYKDKIAAHAPASIAFSPDLMEMFVSGHRDTDVLDRYQYTAGTDTWTEVGTPFNTGKSNGSVLVIP